MNKLFQIGDFVFQLDYPDEITPPPNFMLFEIENKQPDYSYHIRISETFPDLEGTIVAKRPDLIVFQNDTQESRLIGVKGTPGYYACYRELSDDQAEILLAPDRLQGLNIDPVFTSLLALERRLVDRNNMVLHCAYVQYQGTAILFSAPSETGKTTQANLWEKYRNSRTVNGDRALLGKIGSQWMAQGWPVCGTSEVCNNEATPIQAIVMLSQGKENVARQLKPSEAFGLLYSQITINGWNKKSTASALDLIETLIAEIPIYHLSCTISEEAVDCLENILK